jgi:HD-GYP domain-containing protein (c-di-GMP phosphodiesterase class II)
MGESPATRENDLKPTQPSSGIDHARAAECLEAWDHLDSFLEHLQKARDVTRQLQATLDLIRAATRAEAVFLYAAAACTVTEWSGPPQADLAGCARLVRRLLTGSGAHRGHFLCTDLPPAEGMWPVPDSAVLVSLSRSRGAWVGALRFTPEQPLTNRDVKVMCLARRLLHQQQQQQMAQDQLKELLFGLVRCLTASLDARDPYTWGHSERVARIAVRLGEQLGLADPERSDLYLGGLLHDVGKIGVPDEVLRKPGRLTPEEMAQIEQHVVTGDAIVSHVRQLAHLRPLVRSHHERYDGTGYPDRMRGKEIPFAARILAVADGCDAMMSERPYRKALPAGEIESALARGAGSQWDPAVVDAWLGCKSEVFSICERGLGDSAALAVEHALRGAEHGAEAVRSFLALKAPGTVVDRRPAG